MIQKKEEHIIIVDGKKHTANIKIYKFEQLDKNTKLEILTTIKENIQSGLSKDLLNEKGQKLPINN